MFCIILCLKKHISRNMKFRPQKAIQFDDGYIYYFVVLYIDYKQLLYHAILLYNSTIYLFLISRKLVECVL